MSDNVVKFKPRPKPKTIRQMQSRLKRPLTILGIGAAFALVWLYFFLTA
jgi:hypothetical protein